LSLRVWATPLYPHPRGRQFMIRTEARVGAELVWEEASLNLARGPGDESVPAPDGPPSSEALPAAATWKLPGDLGRRYGAVSGDLNPIHLHSLTARLFGFPSAIAHGMWTKARCLAALGSELPERFSVEAAFKRPILLPATVQFAEAAGANAITFGVRSVTRAEQHLDGLVETLP
jgi:acyl dehydratase